MLYLTAWLSWCYDYDGFIEYSVPLLPSICGLFQAISATLTFWFLPKEKDSGFFSDKGILSKMFVRENVFYQLQCVFGAFYYLFKDRMEANIYGQAIVAAFVFYPYTIIRPFFPTTRFDYAQSGQKSGKYRSEENKGFYQRSTTLIRYFYICE